MKLNHENRLAITDEEKQRGLDWLKANGYEFESHADGKLEFFSKQQNDFTIVVLNPHSTWSAHVYDKNRKEIAFNFGDFTEAEEAVGSALEEAGANHLLDAIFGGEAQA